EISRLSCQYQFFHRYLAFPEVFAKSGFDCVLGNPPWEMPEVDDREFFAENDRRISAEASAQKRRVLIADLEKTNVVLYEHWRTHVRRYEGERAFFTASSRFPNAANGRLNYYKLFVEAAWSSVGQFGRFGMVVPSVLATNAYERP